MLELGLFSFNMYTIVKHTLYFLLSGTLSLPHSFAQELLYLLVQLSSAFLDLWHLTLEWTSARLSRQVLNSPFANITYRSLLQQWCLSN